MPDVLYKLTHHFDELLGKSLGNQKWTDYFFFEALQKIDFTSEPNGRGPEIRRLGWQQLRVQREGGPAPAFRPALPDLCPEARAERDAVLPHVGGQRRIDEAVCEQRQRSEDGAWYAPYGLEVPRGLRYPDAQKDTRCSPAQLSGRCRIMRQGASMKKLLPWIIAAALLLAFVWLIASARAHMGAGSRKSARQWRKQLLACQSLDDSQAPDVLRFAMWPLSMRSRTKDVTGERSGPYPKRCSKLLRRGR